MQWQSYRRILISWVLHGSYFLPLKDAGMCTAVVQASTLKLSPYVPSPHLFVLFPPGPLQLNFYTVLYILCDMYKFMSTNRRHYTELLSVLKVNWKPLCLSLSFFLCFSPSVNTHSPPPPPLSPLWAPGLACILGFGIHVSRPIDLLSFFKVRSWNLTQWGIEGQNQPITYSVGREGRQRSYPRGKKKAGRVPRDEE